LKPTSARLLSQAPGGGKPPGRARFYPVDPVDSVDPVDPLASSDPLPPLDSDAAPVLPLCVLDEVSLAAPLSLDPLELSSLVPVEPVDSLAPVALVVAASVAPPSLH
jgi:hypothetical protein